MINNVLSLKQVKLVTIIILLSFSINIDLFAQDEKTVTLTVTGQGKTIDEAKTNALRSSIEQAFGSFISSNTNILNDKLVKDEIVSITNGNIQKYDVLSETTLPDGTFTATLKAIVSVSKLTTFCESKGIKVEFKGGLFAMNMAIQELNVKNELIAWENTMHIIEKLMYKSFDYKIAVQEPTLESNSIYYKIPVKIGINMNQNYDAIIDLLIKFCSASSLSEDEKLNYLKYGKNIFTIGIKGKKYALRNNQVANDILYIPWLMSKIAITNFEVNNGIDNYSLDKYIRKLPIINERIQINNIIENKFSKPFVFDQYEDGGSRTEIYLTGPKYDENKFDGILFAFHEEDGERFLIKDNSQRGYRAIAKKIEDIIIGGYMFEKVANQNRVYNWQYIFNLIDVKDFLEISYNEMRTIEEIKKISEYKISPKYYLLEPILRDR
jgi:hypothetical protein